MSSVEVYINNNLVYSGSGSGESKTVKLVINTSGGTTPQSISFQYSTPLLTSGPTSCSSPTLSYTTESILCAYSSGEYVSCSPLASGTYTFSFTVPSNALASPEYVASASLSINWSATFFSGISINNLTINFTLGTNATCPVVANGIYTQDALPCLGWGYIKCLQLDV